MFCLAPFHETTTEPLPTNSIKKDQSVVKTASIGQRETRELFVETYVFDGRIDFPSVHGL